MVRKSSGNFIGIACFVHRKTRMADIISGVKYGTTIYNITETTKGNNLKVYEYVSVSPDRDTET